jgi:hypothetical protein
MRPLSALAGFSKCLALVCIALVLVGSTAVAAAGPGRNGSGGGGRHTRLTGAPEIDPDLAVAGIVVLIGGTLVLTGRRRPATI